MSGLKSSFDQLDELFSKFSTGDDLKSTNDEISVASTSDGLEEYLIENVDTLISQLNDFEEIGILSPRALFSLMFLSVREDDLSSYTSICTPLLRVLISPSFRSFCPATFYSNFILLCQKLLERVDVVRENTEAVHSLILACLLFIKERTEALPPDRLLDTTLSMLILAKEDVAVESRAVKTWPTALRLIVTRIFRTREISLEIIDKVIAIVTCALDVIGVSFLVADSLFTRTLVSLTIVHFRLQLEGMTGGVPSFGTTIQLLEKIHDLAEEDEAIPDEMALSIAGSLREAASCIITYLRTNAQVQTEIATRDMLASFISKQFALGMGSTLPKEDAEFLLNWFLTEADRDEHGASLSAYFLGCADAFEQLDERVLGVLARNVRREWPRGHWREAARVLKDFIESTSRTDYYSVQSLKEAEETLKDVPVKKLRRLLDTLEKSAS